MIIIIDVFESDENEHRNRRKFNTLKSRVNEDFVRIVSISTSVNLMMDNHLEAADTVPLMSGYKNPTSEKKSLEDTLQGWKNERKQILNKRNDLVFRTSLVLGLIGLGISFPSGLSGTTIGYIFMNFGVLIAVTALSIFATMNPSKFDFNEVFNNSMSYRLGFSALILLSSISYWGKFAPGIIVTMAFSVLVLFKINVCNAFVGSDTWFSFINKCIYFVLVDDILYAIANIYNGYEASHNGSFRLRYGESVGLDIGFLNSNNGAARNSYFAMMYYVIAAFSVFDFIIVTGVFIFQQYLKKSVEPMDATSNTQSPGIEQQNATPVKEVTAQQIYTWNFMTTRPLPDSALLWLYFYAYTNKVGVSGLIKFSFLIQNNNQVPIDDSGGQLDMFVAVSFLCTFILILLPPVFLIAIGPENLFQVTCEFWNFYFERNKNELESIGGWLAQLLESVDVEEGRTWFVSEKVVDEHKRTARDSKSNIEHSIHVSQPLIAKVEKPEWFEGTISLSDEETSRGYFSVTLKDQPNVAVKVRRKESTPFAELQKTAKIMYVDWADIRDRKDIFYEPSHRHGKEAGSNKEIDFFVSHAWADDDITKPGNINRAKYNVLKEFSDTFETQNGTAPTFWLDRCCLDDSEDNLQDSLKMLPVNIMKCKKMIILYGGNYLKRLWCVWELLTICALSDGTIVDKLIILPLKESCDFYYDVKTFDVANATAWEPNDRLRLNEVIRALGTDEFNNKVRSLGRILKQNDGVRSTNAKINYLCTAMDSNAETLRNILIEMKNMREDLKQSQSQSQYIRSVGERK